MTVFAVLKAARAAGVALRVDGTDLVLAAAHAPPSSLLDDLSRHKPAIAELLRRDPEGRSIAALEDCFEERAAIFEYDDGLPRPMAEARAIERCLQELARRDRKRGGRP